MVFVIIVVGVVCALGLYFSGKYATYVYLCVFRCVGSIHAICIEINVFVMFNKWLCIVSWHIVNCMVIWLLNYCIELCLSVSFRMDCNYMCYISVICFNSIYICAVHVWSMVLYCGGMHVANLVLFCVWFICATFLIHVQCDWNAYWDDVCICADSRHDVWCVFVHLFRHCCRVCYGCGIYCWLFFCLFGVCVAKCWMHGRPGPKLWLSHVLCLFDVLLSYCVPHFWMG